MDEQKVIADRPAQQDQSESPDPTGLLYAPDHPGKTRRVHRRRPRPTLSYRKPDESLSKAEREVEKMTLEDAFKLEIEVGDPLNDERAVRAASFLLAWASGDGNEEVDQMLALGVSRVLDLAANNMAQTRRRNHKQAKG